MNLSTEQIRKLLEDAFTAGVIRTDYESIKYKKRYKGKVPLDQQSFINSQLAAIDDIADGKGEVIWLKELVDIRNKLYESIPTGKIDAWEVLQWVKWHINDLDNLCSRIEKAQPLPSTAGVMKWVKVDAILGMLNENLRAMRTAKKNKMTDVLTTNDPFSCIIETYEDLIAIVKAMPDQSPAAIDKE